MSNFINKFMNKFSEIFNKLRIEDSVQEVIKNSVGKSQEDFDTSDWSERGDLLYSNISFYDVFNSKKERVAFYRQMSNFPEISDALDYICDDSIVEGVDGKILNLNIINEVPKNIEKEIRKHFDYLTNFIFNIKEKGWDLYRRWLVDGELYLEVILDNFKKKIIGFKILPCYSMTPLYKGNVIIKYMQTDVISTNNKEIYFEPNQVLYSNYGVYGKNFLDVRGYLEPAIRPYNQLRNMEDALVIYRLVRAPERRIFNIFTGKMTKGKAEEYIKNLMMKYKKRLNYNPETGNVDVTQNIQSLTEDFWFANSSDGKSEVIPLNSGMTLGEIEDINYFLKKLYKTLKLPSSRWMDQSSIYSSGKIGEITREEIKFSNFISRLQRRFKQIFIDALLFQLRLNNIDEKYLNKKLYDIQFEKADYFSEYKQRENIDTMVNTLNTVSQFIITPENKNGLFSREFLFKNILLMDENKYKENEDLIKKEIKAMDLAALEGGSPSVTSMEPGLETTLEPSPEEAIGPIPSPEEITVAGGEPPENIDITSPEIKDITQEKKIDKREGRIWNIVKPEKTES
ncbi:MAG: portal protein [Candidatus Woesearchaeota archaeon]